jgi:hypothetical protein
MGTRTPSYYTGTISGTNGSLITALDAILVTGEGWAKEFSATNKAVYRPPAGSRFRLRVVDDGTLAAGAREALVRAGEGATDVDTLVDPFPTTAQQTDANCVWRKSSSADSTARTYHAVADDRFVVFYVYQGSTAHDQFHFGDYEPTFPGDNYCVGMSIRRTGNSSTDALAMDARSSAVSAVGNAGLYFARTEDGLFKSPAGAYWRILGATPLGTTADATAGTYPHPRTLDLALLQTMVITSGGSAAGTLTTSAGWRGYVPFVFEPMLGTSVSSLQAFDTFTDTAYDAASQFIILPGFGAFSATNFNAGNVVLQTAGTWKTPSF